MSRQIDICLYDQPTNNNMWAVATWKSLRCLSSLKITHTQNPPHRLPGTAVGNRVCASRLASPICLLEV